MIDTLLIIAILALATFGMKATGPAFAGGKQPAPRANRVLNQFAPALIAALVATSTFTIDGSLAIDARLLGVVAGLAALLLRAPVLVAGILAAAVCAIARQMT